MKRIQKLLCWLGMHEPGKYELTDYHISIYYNRIYRYETNCKCCGKKLVEIEEKQGIYHNN
jgi:hypothetical protein